MPPSKQARARQARQKERLAAAAAQPNPFFEPDFVLAAAEGRGEPAALLVVRAGRDWIACLPVERRAPWRSLPLPCLSPWLPAYAYLGDPLVDRDRIEDAVAAIADWLPGQREGFALVIADADEDGPVLPPLLDAFRAHGLTPFDRTRRERAALRRRPDNGYLEDISSKRLKELRRLRRRLADELGPVAVVDRAGDREAVDEFLRLEAAGWKGREGTALAASSGDARFFHSACERLAARGRLQLLALEGGGRTAAMQCNILAGDALFAFKVAYDEQLARFSPGILMEVDAIDVFDGLEGVEMADSCAVPGDNSAVDRLWPDRRAVRTVIVPRSAAAAALVRSMLLARKAVKRLVRT